MLQSCESFNHISVKTLSSIFPLMIASNFSVITKSSHSVCTINNFVLYIFIFAHHRVPNQLISHLSICTGMSSLTIFFFSCKLNTFRPWMKAKKLRKLIFPLTPTNKLHLLQVLSHSRRWFDATQNTSCSPLSQQLTSCSTFLYIHLLTAFGEVTEKVLPCFCVQSLLQVLKPCNCCQCWLGLV